MEIAVQVNGKVKARLKVPADIDAADAIAAAKADPAVAAALEGKQLCQGDLRQGPSGQSGRQGLKPRDTPPQGWIYNYPQRRTGAEHPGASFKII